MEISNIEDLKKTFRPLWNNCKNSQERHLVRDKFYSYRTQFTEIALDKAWTELTSVYRMKALANLDYQWLAMLAKTRVGSN